jgi:hypothetical protein
MSKLFKRELPDCDDLFLKYLSPWYPEEERPQMTRPDMYVISGYKGESLDLGTLQYLSDEFLEKSKKQIQIMTKAALGDYQDIIISDKLDFSVLEAVDEFYNRQKIADLINASDPQYFSNPYLVAVCEFGVTIGHLFNELEGFYWLYSYPYFHSIIVHLETGFGITVFDWGVKKFSEYGADDGYVAKIHAAIDAINEHQKNNKTTYNK